MPATAINTTSVLRKIFSTKLKTIETGQSLAYDLISASRKGLPSSDYLPFLSEKDFFSLKDWANILHVSERTLQRYKQNKMKFDSSLSEKFLEILVILKIGTDVFGDKVKFKSWLNTKNLSLGGSKPKELLDTNFGTNLVKDELIRIAYGVFA